MLLELARSSRSLLSLCLDCSPVPVPAPHSYATPACFDSCKKQDEELLATNLYNKGPVSICVAAATWQYYTGGILSGKSGCKNGYYELDHCVQLVGYGVESVSGAKFWSARNSVSGHASNNATPFLRRSGRDGVAAVMTHCFFPPLFCRSLSLCLCSGPPPGVRADTSACRTARTPAVWPMRPSRWRSKALLPARKTSPAQTRLRGCPRGIPPRLADANTRQRVCAQQRSLYVFELARVTSNRSHKLQSKSSFPFALF